MILLGIITLQEQVQLVYGLGQTAIATVTGGHSTVTAAQWNALLTGIDNIANHTNDSMTARTASYSR